MGLLSPRGSQITTTTVAGTGYAMIMTRERCLLVLEFFFCFFFDQGIGSRSAAWASRVDVVWVSVCDSSVAGWCPYVLWCCIRVALYASCMYPHLLCNVDVMISTLQKRFNMRVYPWWDLRVPFGYGRILGVTDGLIEMREAGMNSTYLVFVNMISSSFLIQPILNETCLQWQLEIIVAHAMLNLLGVYNGLPCVPTCY